MAKVAALKKNSEKNEPLPQTSAPSDETPKVSAAVAAINAAKAALDTEIERLEGEIAVKQNELQELYDARGDSAPKQRISAKREGGGNRINWDQILDLMPKPPKTFTAEDMCNADPRVREKGKPQCYPALNRWEAARQVKKVKGQRGTYVKI